MKTNLIFAITIIILLCTACDSDDSGKNPELSVLPTEIEAPFEGGNYAIKVYSNVEWKVYSPLYDNMYGNTEWLEVKQDADSIYIKVFRNGEETSRQAHIIISAENHITGNNVQKEVTIKQSAIIWEESVTINGVVWATCNVDSFGTFTSSPYHVGRYYQFNNKIGYYVNESDWPPVFHPSEWVNTELTNEWLPINNPCPAGWRFPTEDEVKSLIKSGYSYNAFARGFFFGPNSESASKENHLGCIFLPLTGYCYDSSKDNNVYRASAGWLATYRVEGNYPYIEEEGYIHEKPFYCDSSDGSKPIIANMSSNFNVALTIRCVKE